MGRGYSGIFLALALAACSTPGDLKVGSADYATDIQRNSDGTFNVEVQDTAVYMFSEFDPRSPEVVRLRKEALARVMERACPQGVDRYIAPDVGFPLRMRARVKCVGTKVESDAWGADNPLVRIVAGNQSPIADPSAAAKGEAGFGTYHALVIGNDAYRHLPKLRTAVRDADAVARLLRDAYGFRVTTLTNAKRSDIVQAFDALRRSLRPSDNLLLYYAGHGWLDTAAERGYWLPVDAKSGDRVNWLSNATITDTLKAMAAKHVMVVADSCYSGTLARGIEIRDRRARQFRKLSTKRARTVLTSGGLEPVVDTGGRGHSVFAHAFLMALRDNGAVLDGTGLSEAVRHLVILNAEQKPEYSVIRSAGHDGGDFLFVRRD